MVMLFHTNAASEPKGFLLCKNSGAGVAFLFGIIPVLMITRQFEVNLPRLQLGFL